MQREKCWPAAGQIDKVFADRNLIGAAAGIGGLHGPGFVEVALKILLLNQTFYPDCVATAQYLTQLALGLVERGHEVTCIAGRRAYDEQERLFPKHEIWRGIEIRRIGSTRFGKASRWRRGVDFGSFMLHCTWRVLTLPRHDAVVALTSPPLISFLGALLTRLRGGRFFYWVMDLNPDEAMAAGWLRPRSFAARGLEWLSRLSMRGATRIIALDRFVKQRIVGKGFPEDKVVVIATWSLDDQVQYDALGRESFREQHGLSDKLVVMYSGNHSPCHPLDTLLKAARALASDQRVVFLFVGGGSEWGKVQEYARAHRLRNVRCLPYQPLQKLAGSLSAADVHVVVMGEPFVGIIHPCKIYNILRVGAPVLYIGPEVSHVSELLQSWAARSRAVGPEFGFNGSVAWWRGAQHGDVKTVVRFVQAWAQKSVGVLVGQSEPGRPTNFEADSRLPLLAHSRDALAPFSRAALLPRLIRLIEAGEP